MMIFDGHISAPILQAAGCPGSVRRILTRGVFGGTDPNAIAAPQVQQNIARLIADCRQQGAIAMLDEEQLCPAVDPATGTITINPHGPHDANIWKCIRTLDRQMSGAGVEFGWYGPGSPGTAHVVLQNAGAQIEEVRQLAWWQQFNAPMAARYISACMYVRADGDIAGWMVDRVWSLATSTASGRMVAAFLTPWDMGLIATTLVPVDLFRLCCRYVFRAARDNPRIIPTWWSDQNDPKGPHLQAFVEEANAVK